MALIIGRIKCCFCGEKKGFMHSVHNYGIYGGVRKRIFYHTECLELIEVNPEKYGHNMVDKALDIIELKRKCIKHNNIIKQDHQDKLDTLRTHNFERMIP